MVTLREKQNHHRPPPIYKPPNVYLTVVFHYGGKFVKSPRAKYVGGDKLILDTVVARQLTLGSIKQSLVDWLFIDGDIKVYVLNDMEFKELSTDVEVRQWCVDALGRRKVVFYVEDVVEGGQDTSAAVEEDEEEIEDLDAAVDEVFESYKTNSVGTVMNDNLKDLVSDLGTVYVPFKPAIHGEGSSRTGGSNQFEEEADESESDSDYKAEDETDLDERYHESEDDCFYTDSDKDSEPDVDVVATEFDEYKDSDGEYERPAPVFNIDTIFEPHFELGMIFHSRDVFKKAVQSLAIREKRSLYYSKNAPTRIYAKCCAEGCEWRCHLTKIDDEESYHIREFFNEHKCDTSYNVRNMKPGWLCEKYTHDFVVDRNRPVSTFRQDAMDELGVEISREQAFRAKKKALKKIEGDPQQQYAKLWEYRDELLRTNPGSTVIVGAPVDEAGECIFDKFYVCFDAVKRGFKAGCRPVIGIDGCHLKTAFKGVLLTAVGVDANNGIYPIAWAVVTSETKDIWDWFLAVLKQDLEILDDSLYTFMSDKQKGLIQAMGEVFPNATHRFCVRHLHENFKMAGFRGQAFKDHLWACAEATTVGEWQQHMDELKKFNEAAWEWLQSKPAAQWSKSHFTELSKCDILLNNGCEVFNSTILEAREMTILTMLEWIREWLMRRFQKNRENASLRWKGRICPRIKYLLEENAKKVHDCIPIKGSNHHYQIRCSSGGQYVVDLDRGTCACRSWDLSGIPCKHVICALNHEKLKRDDYVHDCYTIETYKKSYEETIYGVNGSVLWGDSIYIPPLPPQLKKGKGKQAFARKKKPDEKAEKLKKKKRSTLKRKQDTIKCSSCGLEGHNTITCGRENVKKNASRKRRCVGASSSGSKQPEKTPIQPPSTQISTNQEEHEQQEEPSQISTQASQSRPSLIPGPTMLQQLHQGKFKKQGPLILQSHKKFLNISDIFGGKK